jgi:hypothetical protein
MIHQNHRNQNRTDDPSNIDHKQQNVKKFRKRFSEAFPIVEADGSQQPPSVDAALVQDRDEHRLEVLEQVAQEREARQRDPVVAEAAERATEHHEETAVVDDGVEVHVVEDDQGEREVEDQGDVEAEFEDVVEDDVER